MISYGWLVGREGDGPAALSATILGVDAQDHPHAPHQERQLILTLSTVHQAKRQRVEARLRGGRESGRDAAPGRRVNGGEPHLLRGRK